MTSEQLARFNDYPNAASPNFPSAAPLQIRFPARSRKSPTQPVLSGATSKEGLQLAPGHGTVLPSASPIKRNEEDFTVEDQAFDLFGPEELQAAQQESNSDLTAAAVANHATASAGKDVGYVPSRPLSSAGKSAPYAIPTSCKCGQCNDVNLAQVQMQQWKWLIPIQHQQHP